MKPIKQAWQETQDFTGDWTTPVQVAGVIAIVCYQVWPQLVASAALGLVAFVVACCVDLCVFCVALLELPRWEARQERIRFVRWTEKSPERITDAIRCLEADRCQSEYAAAVNAAHQHAAGYAEGYEDGQRDMSSAVTPATVNDADSKLGAWCKQTGKWCPTLSNEMSRMYDEGFKNGESFGKKTAPPKASE